jgi:hypothetical protein
MTKKALVLALVVVMLLALPTACGKKTDSSPTVPEVTPAPTQPVDNAPVKEEETPAPVAPESETPAASEGETPAPEDDNTADVVVAAQMASFLTDLLLVQDYYAEGVNAMAKVAPGSPMTVSASSTGKITVSLRGNVPGNSGLAMGSSSRFTVEATGGNTENVPPEFLQPLPPSGSMGAPPGACPAAAKPSVTFNTQGGEPVTPQLIADKAIEAIPSNMVTVPDQDPGSLTSLINSLVPLGDPRLAMSSTWNTMLWDELKKRQVPAASLMDYQVWNTSAELEQQVVEQYRQQLQASGVPQIVMNAYDSSSKTGWYTSTRPAPEDALARMDIVAEMTGSVEGTVHEQRDFYIPGLGQSPVYGVQTGEGIVNWEHPGVGTMSFSVDILLDQYDAMGRAIGGNVVAVATEEAGYEVHFTFLPDGSKEGEVIKEGEVVGKLTMTVDEDKFENYIDVKEGTEIKLPELGTAGG